MKVTPKTDDELAKADLIKDRTYPFDIIAAEEAISKKGAEMIKVKLKIYGEGDRYAFINDYLLDAFPKKINHLCKQLGLVQQYMDGELKSEMLVGKSGYVKIAIREAKGDFGPQNSVVDYVGKPSEEEKQEGMKDDTKIPF